MEFPLELEARIAKEYPGLLAQLEGATFARGAEIAGRYALARGMDVGTALDRSSDAVTVSRWREHRVIYRVDRTLAEELLAQCKRMDDDEELPTELLYNLPYPAFAVSGPALEASVEGHTGRFGGECIVTISRDEEHLPWPALYTVWREQDTPVTYFLPLVPGTLADSIKALNEFHTSTLGQEVPMWRTKEQAAPCLLAAQIVLYLQSQGADVQRRPTGPAGKRAKGKKVTADKIRQCDVGIRVGATIRRATAYNASGRTRQGGPVRPHTRRGHWHRFWVGPKAEPEQRRLIVKWLHPMLVNGGSGGETTTIYPLAGEKKKK